MLWVVSTLLSCWPQCRVMTVTAYGRLSSLLMVTYDLVVVLMPIPSFREPGSGETDFFLHTGDMLWHSSNQLNIGHLHLASLASPYVGNQMPPRYLYNISI